MGLASHAALPPLALTSEPTCKHAYSPGRHNGSAITAVGYGGSSALAVVAAASFKCTSSSCSIISSTAEGSAAELKAFHLAAPGTV
jgi:hypothetical protein